LRLDAQRYAFPDRNAPPLTKIPWLKPLAWQIGRPGIRPGLARLYH
jgi:hypothetical protein